MKKNKSKKEEYPNNENPVIGSSLKFWLRKAFEGAKEGRIEKIPVLIDQYGGVNIEEHFVPNKYPAFEDWYDQIIGDLLNSDMQSNGASPMQPDSSTSAEEKNLITQIMKDDEDLGLYDNQKSYSELKSENEGHKEIARARGEAINELQDLLKEKEDEIMGLKDGVEYWMNKFKQLQSSLSKANEEIKKYVGIAEALMEAAKKIDKLESLAALKEDGWVDVKPKVVCFCGSTRFAEWFMVKRWELEKQGIITLGINILPNNYFAEGNSHGAEQEGVKDVLDELHKRKIDLSDEVYILNVGGYIGESTRNELTYAIEKGKAITYLEEPLPQPPVTK